MPESKDDKLGVALSGMADQIAEMGRAADDYVFTVDLAVVLFQVSPDAVIVADEGGIMRLVNTQAEFITGYHKSELRGQHVEMLLPEALRERHVAVHRPGFMAEPRMRAMGSELNLKLRRKNGDEVAVDINLSPIVTVRGMYVIAAIRKRSSQESPRGHTTT